MQPKERGSFTERPSTNPRRLSFRESSTVLIHKQLPNAGELKAIPRPPGVGVSSPSVMQLSQPSSRANSQGTPGTPGSMLEERRSPTSSDHVAFEEDVEWAEDPLNSGMGDFGDEDDQVADGAYHGQPRLGRFSDQVGLQALLNDENDGEEDGEESIAGTRGHNTGASTNGTALDKKSTLTYGVYPWRKSTRQGKPSVNENDTDDDDDLDLGLHDDDDDDGSDRDGDEWEEQEEVQQQEVDEETFNEEEEAQEEVQGTEATEEDVVCEKENHNDTASNRSPEPTTQAEPATPELKKQIRCFRVCDKTGTLDEEFKHLYETVDDFEVPCSSPNGTTNITLPVCFI